MDPLHQPSSPLIPPIPSHPPVHPSSSTTPPSELVSLHDLHRQEQENAQVQSQTQISETIIQENGNSDSSNNGNGNVEEEDLGDGSREKEVHQPQNEDREPNNEEENGGEENENENDNEEEENEEEEDEEFIPPENLAMVVKGIYRSAFPKKKNFPYLKRLGLKSVLTLILEDYPEQNKKFLDENGITLFQFGVAGNKEPFVDIPEDKICAALSVMMDRRNHPRRFFLLCLMLKS